MLFHLHPDKVCQLPSLCFEQNLYLFIIQVGLQMCNHLPCKAVKQSRMLVIIYFVMVEEIMNQVVFRRSSDIPL